jgi:hypothetical protein
MTDIHKMIERQAAWQKGRAALTWVEKVRMAEAVREDVANIRKSWGAQEGRGFEIGGTSRGKGRAERKKKEE